VWLDAANVCVGQRRLDRRTRQETYKTRPLYEWWEGAFQQRYKV
jgi:hypothetical protein